ncbi:MAG: class I SAM-dependent methyltransferase [Candidatus Shapirobacteria bacterium]|jgi:SAM-dependent methyltransferase
MNCPLCFSKENTTIFIATNFHGHYQLNSQKIIFKKCLKCGCIFPKIIVDRQYYQKYYPQNYQTKSNLLTKIWQKLNDSYKYKFIPKNSRLLDIGCGQADYLKSLPQNVQAFGIDINPPQGKNLIKDDFLKHDFSQKFDTITFWHSLEHFSHPCQVVKKSISLLNKHGRILISIPNTNSLAFRISQNKWFHLDPPRHLFLPNDQNIKKLFPKNSKLKINYLPWEFPLDLFWSFYKKPYLRILYPILKIFDRETIFIYFEKA